MYCRYRSRQARLTEFAAVTLEAEWATALERVSNRHAPASIETGVREAGVLAVVNVYATYVFLQKLQRALVHDDLENKHDNLKLKYQTHLTFNDIVYFLDASLERLADVSCRHDFVEVAVTSDEEVKG